MDKKQLKPGAVLPAFFTHPINYAFLSTPIKDKTQLKKNRVSTVIQFYNSKVMEASTQNKTASTVRGLEIRLHMAQQYRRFAKRVLPNTGEWVAATMHFIELSWAIEDARQTAK